MKRAVLYARVSTDAQQKEGTIDSQVLELKRQIAAAGDVLVKEYVDDGYSGSLLDRPGLETLRRDVRTPLFDAVYFLDTDRIARGRLHRLRMGELPRHALVYPFLLLRLHHSKMDVGFASASPAPLRTA
jgi:site-specific DNA recombinase